MFKQFAKKYNLPNYRITQIYEGYYKNFISSWDELTTLPKGLRLKLEEEIPFSKLIYVSNSTSKDGNTNKVLFKTEKGNYIESVLMKEKDRNTVCVSCMSGCPVGCVFCATGQMGFKENLDSQQILDQILYFCRKLRSKNEKVTNIVYMGMGEPLLNLENVARSIMTITDKGKLSFSKRRVTLSTSGHVQNLRILLAKNLGIKIAISLHTANQKLRETLMPGIAVNNPLKTLLDTLDSYTQKSNKRITYEYVLLRDVNDSVEDAKELANLLKRRLALVNLINYNEVDCLPFKKSKKAPLFKKILEGRDITCTIRKSLGEDIKGACGQLGI